MHGGEGSSGTSELMAESKSETTSHEKGPTKIENSAAIRKWVAHNDEELKRFIETDRKLFLPDSIISKEWRDSDLIDFSGMEYDHCSIKDFITIGYGWLSSLYKPCQLEELASVTVWLALHLMTPDDRKGLIFKVEWQKPYGPSQELKNVTATHMIEKLEKVSKSEIWESMGNRGEDIEFLGTVNRFRHNLEADLYITECKNMLSAIKSLPDILQASLYSFLAATLCRMITEHPNVVYLFFVDSAINQFTFLYNAGKLPFNLIPPRFSIFQHVSYILRPCSPLTVCLLKGFLSRYKTLVPDLILGNYLAFNSYRNMELLRCVLLQPISMNGLEFVRFAMKAMRKLGLTGFGQLFNDFYGQAQATSLKHLSKFSEIYLSTDSDDVLYPWATLFSLDYFEALSLRNNSIAAGFFMGIIDSDSMGSIWRTEGLDLDSEEKRYISSAAKQYKMKMMKTRFHDQLQEDVNA